ncbi:MAG TPA: hypothetical protein VE007_00180 [Thermoanaerobaculia bacterium]|nr:hypothetical protein [Thermoanaerobaculia bacterium]
MSRSFLVVLLFFGCAALRGGDRTGPAFAVAPPGPGGARSLTLAPDLSFTDDSSSNFPIRGSDLSDGRVASDRPTAVFFGTAHCWNTNREAERFVALYAKAKETARFIVVDLEHPSADQKTLVSRLYSGLIPTVAFLDRTGAVVYDRAGETAGKRGDTTRLEELLRNAASAAR